jgi:hypothetical protein
MSTLQTVLTMLGIVAAVLGIVGGLLSLPGSIRKFLRERQPHGRRGMGFLVLNRTDNADATIVRFLVVEDLFQSLTNLAQEKSGGVVTDVQAVGEYYVATIKYPPGSDLSFRIVKRR